MNVEGSLFALQLWDGALDKLLTLLVLYFMLIVDGTIVYSHHYRD